MFQISVFTFVFSGEKGKHGEKWQFFINGSIVIFDNAW